MAGIYIHIPFCKQQCSYCDFHFSTTFTEYRTKMIEAIVQEISMRKAYLNNQEIESIYFGGGTPSLLREDELQLIIQTIVSLFQVSQGAEITLESNPDDISEASLKSWKEAGINRLSIGIQSFKASDLNWMNRAHNVEEAENCVSLAMSFGFENLTVDLIYGLPDLTNAEWEQHILKTISMGVTHISAYCLTVEEKTALNTLVKKGTIVPASEETQSEQFEILVKTLAKHGFEQYEVSNFCKPNHEALHNSNYWKSKHYLGVGPSAHSFNGFSRSWNVRNNQAYMNAVAQGNSFSETEILSPEDQLNEILLTGLRTKFGVSISRMNAIIQLDSDFWNQVFEFKKLGLLIQKDDLLQLTEKGFLQADRIASDLFILKH